MDRKGENDEDKVSKETSLKESMRVAQIDGEVHHRIEFGEISTRPWIKRSGGWGVMGGEEEYLLSR